MEDRVISLRKDRVISLTKSGKSDGLKLPYVFVGLSWGKAVTGRKVELYYKKVYTGNFIQRLLKIGKYEEKIEDKIVSKGIENDVDLDASILIYDSDKKLIDEVYYNHKESLDGAILHYGDDRSGSDKKGLLDNEIIKINLKEVSQKCRYLVAVINSYSHHFFTEIPYLSMRIYSNDTENESDLSKVLATYKIDNSPEFNGKESLVIGVFYRSSNQWEFKAVGKVTSERSLRDISKGSAIDAIKSIQ